MARGRGAAEPPNKNESVACPKKLCASRGHCLVGRRIDPVRVCVCVCELLLVRRTFVWRASPLPHLFLASVHRLSFSDGSFRVLCSADAACARFAEGCGRVRLVVFVHQQGSDWHRTVIQILFHTRSFPEDAQRLNKWQSSQPQ